MGETICRSCGGMNWHLFVHRTGNCQYCGKHIDFCDSCGVAIPVNGDEFGKRAAEIIRKLKDGR